MSTDSRTQAIAQLKAVVNASGNGLPTLARALEALTSAPNSSQADADAALLADCVIRAVRQMRGIVVIGSVSNEWEQAPAGTLLRDLPGMRPRGNLELLILRALERPVSTFGAVLALFKGGPSLPFIADLRVLATEIVDGLTIGEVNRWGDA